MKILVIGSGGREHALVWKIAQSRRVSKIYCAPGNGGIAEIAECIPIPADDVPALLEFAHSAKIDLTVVGPEAPLVLGITDSFKRQGLKIFGPGKESAALEGSKAFAKEFLAKYGIPTARSRTFENIELAQSHIRGESFPIVIKADGLAAGKGVVICHNPKEAEDTLLDMLVLHKFGDAGKRVIIEEYLEGCEASFIAICDGNHVLPLASSQDHKRVFDGDLGPNTGGMGAISPAWVVTNEVATDVMNRIMLPAARGMVTEGMPFVGVLYAGLMIKDGLAKVLEFNVRFGDPETQPLMMRLKTDIVDVFEAAVTGMLHQISLEWDPRPAACVVMASGGYPGSYKKGCVIKGIEGTKEISDLCVFHSGTKKIGPNFVTDRGRVLGVTALGTDLCDAISRAYGVCEMITWDGVHYRKDIGHRR